MGNSDSSDLCVGLSSIFTGKLKKNWRIQKFEQRNFNQKGVEEKESV